MDKLTDKQQAVLDFCREFFAENDALPTTRVIARHFGNWQTAAAECLVRLENKGHLQRNSLGNYMFARAEMHQGNE